MNSEDLRMLTEESPALDHPAGQSMTDQQWQAVEQLNDLLASSTDLQQILKAGLHLIHRNLGGTAVALYIPRICENLSEEWTCINLPASFQKDLEDGLSPLSHLIEQALTTGTILPGNNELNLAGVFPVSTEQGIIGALLVTGPVIPADAYQLWLAFLRPVARVVMFYARAAAGPVNMPSYRDLISSRNTLRALFDSLPISIYIIDSEYKLVAVNNSRAERAEQTPRLLVGRTCFEGLFKRSSPCHGCQVAATFTTGQSTRHLRRDWLDQEKFIEWEINTFAIQAGREAPGQIIIVESDVTEKRNLEANLVQSEKLAAVGQLAAGVAHEINNPLTAIIANVQLLLRDIPPDQIDLLDSVKLIQTASTRAQQVIRNLLRIARKEKYHFEPVDINQTLQNALSLVQHQLVGRPIQVVLSMEDDMPPINGSQDHLQGLWINLFLNAIDAIDKNNGLISISSRFSGSEFQIIVQDNGIGIQPEYLNRVFEPFFTTKASGRGTGLGLSVCSRVVRQHGGNITAESEPGSWTRFTITLPGPG